MRRDATREPARRGARRTSAPSRRRPPGSGAACPHPTTRDPGGPPGDDVGVQPEPRAPAAPQVARRPGGAERTAGEGYRAGEPAFRRASVAIFLAGLAVFAM